jgi:hypothetical protein
MARYIDADKLIQRLEREVESCKDPSKGSALGFKMAIFIAQTLADEQVVPRAEIDRLKQNNADRVEFFSALIEAEKRKAERLKTIAEAEAIKEFARRVKATFPSREDPRCTDDDIFTLDSIDTIMNDMLSVLKGENK